jgi:hypothetical protein
MAIDAKPEDATAISFELMDEQSVATKVDPRWSRAVVTVMNAGNVGILGSGDLLPFLSPIIS